MAADACSVTFLYPSSAYRGWYRWKKQGEELNNRFYVLSDEHLEGWMNQSVRVALGYVASVEHLHPAASDADSLFVSNVAMVSCSLQTQSRWKRNVMQLSYLRLKFTQVSKICCHSFRVFSCMFIKTADVKRWREHLSEKEQEWWYAEGKWNKWASVGKHECSFPSLFLCTYVL